MQTFCCAHLSPPKISFFATVSVSFTLAKILCVIRFCLKMTHCMLKTSPYQSHLPISVFFAAVSVSLFHINFPVKRKSVDESWEALELFTITAVWFGRYSTFSVIGDDSFRIV